MTPDRATEAIGDEKELIRAVHFCARVFTRDPRCSVCGTTWPCLTIRALNAAEARVDTLTAALVEAHHELDGIVLDHPALPLTTAEWCIRRALAKIDQALGASDG